MKNFFSILAGIMIIGIIGYFINENLAQNEFKGLDYSRVETVTVLDDITASTTSGIIDINGADRVTLSLSVADTGSVAASSTFTAVVSVDGTNYVTFNKFIDNVANTNAEMITRVASMAIGADTTKFYSMDLQYDNFKFMKLTDTIVGIGTTTVNATALINY